MLVGNKQQPTFWIGKIFGRNFAESSVLGFFQKLSKVNFEALILCYFFVLAGEEQRHFVHNAFNVLINEGFFRDQQGVYTLEVVQQFYQIIKKTPTEATKMEDNLETLCPSGVFTFDNQAVITLVYDDSNTNQKYYHAVRVSRKDLSLWFTF